MQTRNYKRAKANATTGLYPLTGVYYFVTHPFLLPLMRARLIPCILLSGFVLFTLFFWTYLPQVAFLALFNSGRGGALTNGAFLVLGEGAAITAILFEIFLVDEALIDVFDATLIKEGFEDLVSNMRTVDPDPNLNPRQRLGKQHTSSTYSPFSLRQIIEFVILLPLNFIPWVGIPAFIFLTGYRAGPLQHWRYFKLKGFAKKDRKAFVTERRTAYTLFGTIHLCLQLIPVLSMPFLLTSAAGSALWAARLERQSRNTERNPERVEPAYVDDLGEGQS